ncbi:MAG: S9 family peptidase [Bacteroidaceae bacterium]|nr:S9 family peptidase [Bacteroidaceae bacterium]
MKKLFFCITGLLFTMFTFAQQITLEDITAGKYSAKRFRGITPMADGESYAQISADGKKIERHSFKTGAWVETLFDVATARDAKIGSFSNYILSPDEKNILIETDPKPIYRHSCTASYYIYNVRNKTMVPLSKGGPQECPKFSPDGNVIGFVRDNNIFLVKLLYNNAESQVTKDGDRNKIINGKADWVNEEEFSMNGAFDFSANSEMIAWIRYDETAVPTYTFPWYQGASPAMQDYRLYPGIYEYKYPKAGEVNSKVSVHSFDIKSRVVRDIKIPVESDGYIPRIQFTGTDDKLMVLTLNRHQNQLDFYLADARSTTANLILREKNAAYVDELTYRSLDFRGSQFVLLSERDGYRHLYLYNANGQLVKQLTKGGFEVCDYYGHDAAGKNFYYASNEGSPLEQYIYKVDISGKRTKLIDNKGMNNAVFSKGCNYFLNVFSNLQTPYISALYSATGKQLKVLEDNAAQKSLLAGLSLGKAELFSFKTKDGIELNGWMVKPASFNEGKKYPVIMYQYSGPGSQEVHNSFGNGFYGGLIWEQRLASKGYIVVCVDGRGTGGRGADFQRCTYKKLGDLESHDQAEVAAYLGTLPFVDKSRIGIWGWSFGGFNTIMSMCEGRGLFRCGVAVAPVTDWRYYDTVYTERFMRTPQENASGYDCSPLHRYRNLKGDLLLIHGTADDNVHFQNTAELAEALVQADIQFDTQVYTNRNHSIFGGNTRRHLFTRIENFFDTHLLK